MLPGGSDPQWISELPQSFCGWISLRLSPLKKFLTNVALFSTCGRLSSLKTNWYARRIGIAGVYAASGESISQFSVPPVHELTYFLF